MPNPLINDTITLSSTPDDFVSFYSRALTGEFFQYRETLDVFRAILSLPDIIGQTVPLGVNGFAKGGTLDFGDEHILTLAGGLWVARRWISFALMMTWTDAEAGPVDETMPAFTQTARSIFTLVRDRWD